MLLETDPGVVEAACRLVCTITAKNPDTQACILADKRVLEKLLGMNMPRPPCVFRFLFHAVLVFRLFLIALINRAAEAGDVISRSIAAGAMWALCALVMLNPQVQVSHYSHSEEVPFLPPPLFPPTFLFLLLRSQRDVAARPGVIASVTTLLKYSDMEEVQSGSAWLLCNLAAGVSSIQTLLVQVFYLDADMGVLAFFFESRSFTLMRIQELGVMESLLDCIRDPAAAHSTKGLAAWAVRTIVNENPPNQARTLRLFSLVYPRHLNGECVRACVRAETCV